MKKYMIYHKLDEHTWNRISGITNVQIFWRRYFVRFLIWTFSLFLRVYSISRRYLVLLLRKIEDSFSMFCLGMNHFCSNQIPQKVPFHKFSKFVYLYFNEFRNLDRKVIHVDSKDPFRLRSEREKEYSKMHFKKQILQ